jgi:hypothetical protein
MVRKALSAASSALVIALLAGCSQGGTAPTAPAITADDTAAADGSTLKVTAPALMSPTGGVRTDTLEPEFVVGPATARFGNNQPFEYRFDIQTMNGQAVVSSLRVPQGSDGRARVKLPVALTLDTRYRWRARAELGTRMGPWSDFGEFLSLDYRGLVPRPFNGNWPNTGPAVVEYIMGVFPEYLHPTALTAQRIEHMEFLRDRVIEAGICGGLDVAWNLKRNIGPHSHDAIAWRKPNGFVEVVDIASAFDDKTIPLVLHWQIVAGPPGYDKYTNHPGC